MAVRIIYRDIYVRHRRRTAPIAVSGNVSVTLVDVFATGAVGSFVPEVDITQGAVFGTGAVGSFNPGAADTLASVFATGALGSTAPEVDVNGGGVAGTGAVAGASGKLVVTLGGVAAFGIAGSFVFAGGAPRRPQTYFIANMGMMMNRGLR